MDASSSRRTVALRAQTKSIGVGAQGHHRTAWHPVDPRPDWNLLTMGNDCCVLRRGTFGTHSDRNLCLAPARAVGRTRSLRANTGPATNTRNVSTGPNRCSGSRSACPRTSDSLANSRSSSPDWTRSSAFAYALTCRYQFGVALARRASRKLDCDRSAGRGDFAGTCLGTVCSARNSLSETSRRTVTELIAPSTTIGSN